MPAARKETRWFALGLTFAAALVMAQLYFKFRIEVLLGDPEKHGEAWRFNMVVVTYALFVPALLAIVSREPVVVAVSLISIGVAIMLSQSATSKIALATAIIVYTIARLLPRKLTLAIFGFAILSLLAFQPWQGYLVDQALKVTNTYASLFSSGKERIVIWQATGEMTLRGLPWGFGVGSSDVVSETSIAKSLPPDVWVGLRQTHAHNAFLNVMLELGLPGLVGMLLIAVGLIRSLSRLSETVYAPSLALSAEVIVVDLISHGAWQAWWITGIMIAISALKQTNTKQV
jgi:O-antigen ligase